MLKKSTNRAQKQFVAENEDLRARLDEAEDTLRAIRGGEVDALVVSGVNGDQVFTLTGADHSYRILIENMSEGALTVTAEGLILYANRCFAEMLRTPLEKVIGSIINTWVAPDSQQILQSLLIKDTDENRRAQLLLTTGDGTPVPVSLSMSNLLINEMPESFCVVVTDLTEQKRSDELAVSEKMARELFAASSQSRLALLSVIEDQKLLEEKLLQTMASLKNAFSATIQVMTSAVEARDPYTAGHQLRSAYLARAIATEMGFNQDRIEAIHTVTSIHDIGKLSIPAEILSKPVKLSENEFSLIKEHSRSGYEMLKDVESPWPLAEIIYQHHERMDGSGYPRNLKGDEILIEARILAVCDVVEAMASHRPYRPALGINAALEELEKNRGTLYDADVVDTCLRLFRGKNYTFGSEIKLKAGEVRDHR